MATLQPNNYAIGQSSPFMNCLGIKADNLVFAMCLDTTLGKSLRKNCLRNTYMYYKCVCLCVSYAFTTKSLKYFIKFDSEKSVKNYFNFQKGLLLYFSQLLCIFLSAIKPS